MWPIDIDLKFMEPVGRELKSVGKVKLRTLTCIVVSNLFLNRNAHKGSEVCGRLGLVSFAIFIIFCSQRCSYWVKKLSYSFDAVC